MRGRPRPRGARPPRARGLGLLGDVAHDVDDELDAAVGRERPASTEARSSAPTVRAGSGSGPPSSSPAGSTPARAEAPPARAACRRRRRPRRARLARGESSATSSSPVSSPATRAAASFANRMRPSRSVAEIPSSTVRRMLASCSLESCSACCASRPLGDGCEVVRDRPREEHLAVAPARAARRGRA